MYVKATALLQPRSRRFLREQRRSLCRRSSPCYRFNLRALLGNAAIRHWQQDLFLRLPSEWQQMARANASRW